MVEREIDSGSAFYAFERPPYGGEQKGGKRDLDCRTRIFCGVPSLILTKGM